MATATFIGPRASFSLAGLTFAQGVSRPVPDAAVTVLASHPWFQVTEPEKPRRGRPPKVRHENPR